MKRILLLVAVAALGGCNAGRSAVGGVEQVGAGLGGAVTAPLDDLNLRQRPVPIVLLQAQANPYDLRNLNQCTTIGAEVVRLDEALGLDTDEPPRQDGSYASERAADAAARATLDAIRGTTTDFIPMRSWVRRLSGAEQHSRDVQAAIQAGRLRRAFLKGIGMQRNCYPPAAPSWYRPRS